MNNRYWRYVLLAILLLPAAVTMAQYDAFLTGHVIDERTGEHLAFVDIRLKGTNIGGITNESGHYLLQDLPIGKQTVVFSYVGYETLELPVTIEADKTVELKATLREANIMVDNIVVTANRYETKRKESSAMVSVVSPHAMEATSAVCMADALHHHTGLRVEKTCSNCGHTALRINGLDGQYSQILIDSRPIFPALASVYTLEQIPAGLVDHIEVIRGSGSALFGANAVAGVVNIITKEPVRNHINLSNTSQMLRTSSYDISTTLNASVVSESHKAGAVVSAVQRNRHEYDHNGDGFSDLPALGSTTVSGKAFFKTSAYSKLTAHYSHITDYRRGGNFFDKEPHEADIAIELKHNIDAGGLGFNWFSADNRHFVSVYSDVQHVSRTSYFGTQQDLNAYGRSRETTSMTGIQYRFSYQCGKMPADLSIGAEYTYDYMHDRMTGYGRDLSQHVHLYGGYVQNEWKNDMWSLLLGARLEKHNMLSKPVCTPRVNLRYTPVDGVILRTGYAGGYRAPQTYEEDLHVAAVGGEVSLISLDTNLRPEYSHSVSLSGDLYKRFGNWETNLTLEGFYTHLQDVFFLREEGHDADGNLLITRTNASGAWVAGLNVEAKVAYKEILRLQLGYTYQQSRYLEAEQWSSDPDILPQTRMLRTPDHHAHLVADITPVRNFTISLSGKVTGSMLVPHHAGYISKDEEVLTKPFCELGIRLSYDIHLYKHYCLIVNGGVKNVLNQYQSDLDKGVMRDADYTYGPATPRTYFIGIDLKI